MSQMDRKTRQVVVKGFVSKTQFKPTKKASEDQVRESLHYSNVDGALSSMSGSIFNYIITPLALFLKATNAEIGLLNSAQDFASTAAYIPGAKATEYFSRKTVWMIARIMSRLVFVIPLLLLPFMGAHDSVIWLIITIALIQFFMTLSTPAWASLMGDLVPQEIRGRYFGYRNMLIAITGMVATIAAGFLLSWYGFELLIIFYCVLGMLAVPYFLRMYEPVMPKVFHYSHSFPSPGRWISSMRANHGLVIFTLFMLFMNFAVNVASPFYAVYMLKDLKIDYTMFAILTTLGAAARIVTYKYWGRLNDKYGSRKILLVTASLSIFTPFLWLWAGNAAAIALVMIYDGLVWAGFDTLAFNYLLDIVPADRRPQYVANYNFFVGLGVGFGALAGGLLATVLQGQIFLIFFGLQLIFLTSFALRVACLVLLPKIPEIDVAHSRLVPVRYVFWQALAVEPARGIQNAISYTFRYPYEIEKQFSTEIKKIGYKVRMAKS